MNARILVPVLLIAACLLLLFRSLAMDTDTGGATELTPSAPSVEEEERTIATPELDAKAELQAPPAEPGVDPVAEEQAERREVSAFASWPEEDTRWLDVRIELPADLPRDEAAWVVALAESGGYHDIYGEDGPMVALYEGRDPRSVEGTLAAVSIGASGEERLALPPDTEEAWLVVGGSYLYSLEPLHVVLGDVEGSAVVQPVLGAWVTGRLTSPVEGESLSDIEITMRRSMNARLELGTAASGLGRLRTRTGPEGTFDFRAVPVGKPQTISTDSPHFAAAFTEDISPEAGGRMDVELSLSMGGTVRGRVVDEKGDPIAEAEVMALGREFFGSPTVRLRETESDADGRFELTAVSSERVFVRAQHDDYQDFLDQPFELGLGEERDHGDVVLTEGLAIAGTVVFPGGAPAVGTVVRVDPDLSENVSGSPVDQRDYAGARNSEAVDEDGSFRITGLGPGPWVVTAELHVEPESEDGWAFGRWTVSQATVRAPSEEIAFVLNEPVHVSGSVTSASGEPIPAFTIRAERAGSQWYMPPSEEKSRSFESEDGRFLFENLRAGDWTFSASGEGYARSSEVEMSLPGEEELALVLLRPVKLAGVVLDPDGKTVADAEVSKELEGTEVFEAMQGRGDWPVAHSEPNGDFVLVDLPPGAGSVLAKKDGFAPSAAVPFELAEGEQMEDIELRLRRGGTIEGEVYAADGEPAGGCVLILQMPTLQERRFSNADPDGTFVESGLTPGTWQVQAFPGIESLQSASGEALDQAALLAALKMTTVELEDEAVVEVVLGEMPEDPVVVHGRVTLGGEAVGESIISFVPAGGGGMESLKIKSLDERGEYELQLDEPGDYLVTIQTTSSPGRQNSVEFRRSIPEVEEHRLDFEMPLGRVSGRVLGSDGAPLASARVTLNMDGGLVFGTVFGGQYNETTTNESGEYDILYLRPGRYTVAAGGTFLGGFFGTDSALGREVTVVEVGEDEWVRGIDFELSEPGAITGMVRDAAGTPVADASIFLRDDDGRLLELFSISQTNASGRFEYKGLAPGDYTITARTGSLASAASAAVRVRAAETTETTVLVEAGTTLLVTLLDKSGEDVPSRVSVLDENGHEMNGMLGLTEIMERYNGGLDSAVQRVGPLPPGKYEVRAIAEDGRSTSRPVNVDGRAERKVKLRLK